MKNKSLLLISIGLALACVALATPAWTQIARGALTDIQAAQSSSVGPTLADLAGTWSLNVICTGPYAPYWDRGTFVIQSNGRCTYSHSDSDGSSGNNYSASFSLSSSGFALSGAQIPKGTLCQMDLGKSVLACTMTSSSGSSYLAIFLKQADSYFLDDFGGDWEYNALDSGPTNPSWMRITGDTIDDDGSYSGSYSDSYEATYSASGQMSLSGSGEVKQTTCISGPCPDSSFSGYMDAGKSIIVGTYGVIASTPDAVLTVFTKMAPSGSYSRNDLAGVWNGNLLASGPDAPWWQRLSGTIKADGTSTISSTQNNGKKKKYTGLTWSISNNGVVTISSALASNSEMVMNSDKTVMVETGTWGDGSTEFGIFTKSAGLPGAPTGVGASAGNAQASVSFTSPAANGSAISSYTVTSSADASHPDGVTAKGSKSPIIVKGPNQRDALYVHRYRDK